MTPPRDRLLAALDVGSSKVCCLIGRVGNDGLLHLSGMGHRKSNGLKHGAVADRDATQRALSATVDLAERSAGETITDVLVSISAGELYSQVTEQSVNLREAPIHRDDVDAVLGAAARARPADDNVTVHAFPAAYALDGRYQVKAPMGMYGRHLGVALHTVKAPAGPARNLETCVRGAHLQFDRFVAAPYAAGFATLVEEERAIGTACVDIGAGTTDISLWAEGAMVHLDVIPMGGDTLTEAIARELVTPLDHAERLKTLYGAASVALCSDREHVDVVRLGRDDLDGNTERLPRQVLANILIPELEALFEQVRQRLQASGFDGVAGRQVVLTGGTAQLQGIEDMAATILDKQVRIGQPRRVAGLPSAAQNPAFATAVGVLLHAIEAPDDLSDTAFAQQLTTRPVGGGGMSAMWRWVKEHF
ncbi:cell division protein FtsA [Rhodothalassium salexigens]|uniref:cell division protein FtsA n=1 Tax=Rhodothalassium salexigens TaxID=1086 RepID=UPI001912CD0F|nr:cell division protein FtsA [Rhodothalassium salexigens]MBK5911711.1 cell division protein FtsA [Rhodothalassium salexigens]MBK5919700.1 cell division protein FtsA [Rhodothalassium salexigens]